MENLVLIGMPGAGKSTVGVVLAKILQYDFIDSDLVIQKREGRRLCEIIEQDGLERFLEIEATVNAGLAVDKSVIATGGSVVYAEAAMEHLRSIGRVVYLKLSYDTLKHRLGDLKNRGVAMKTGQTLRDLYEERAALYEKYADITIEADGLSIEETIQRVNFAYTE